jgi:putative transposase
MFGYSLRKDLAFDWNNIAHRIERLQPNDELLLERVDDAQLSIVTRSKLLSEYTLGHIKFLSSDAANQSRQLPTFSRPLDELSEAVRRELRRRQHYVQAVLDAYGVVFTKAAIQPLTEEVATRIADQNPPSLTTLYRWYSRYRITKDMRSLVPRIDRRGSSLLRQSPQVLELASDAIQEAFKASPRATGNNIYVRLVAKINELNRRSPILERIKCPSERTVYRLIIRLGAFEKAFLREGKRIANNRFRLAKGGVSTSKILERIEIDHTPLDLFLIDEVTWLPLGRPTLTVVIDHYSRMPLGYYLSFGSPSVAAVMGALRHAILPKEPVKETIPNLQVHHAWTCYGLPDLFVLDNGMEFIGHDLESIAFDLGIRLLFCPKKQPWFKGVIERYLKTINYFFASQLPGTTYARLHQRGDYDPLKHALLTLTEFKHLFEKWVVDVYAQSIHKGIGTTPWAKWQEGLTRREPALPEDIRMLQRRIGHVTERTLRSDGVLLNGIRYNDDSVSPILNAFGSGVKVRVVSDADNLGEIQVWGPADQDPVTVRAVDYTYANGLTQLQNELIQTHMREQGLEASNREHLQQAKHDISQAVQELMISRKHKNRRTAAAIRRINNPEPNIVPIKAPTQKQINGKATLKPVTIHVNQMPAPAYQAFQLNTKPESP